MKKTAFDFWAGLFVITGFLAVLFLVLKVSNINSLSFQETYQIIMKFDNIGGLKSHAAIKSSGVIVGHVSRISFDTNTYQAFVIADLYKQYHFPKDSSAKILALGLLGDQYIDLEPGGDTEMLKSGDTISMTQSAIMIENLIGQLLYRRTTYSEKTTYSNRILGVIRQENYL
ncbi:MAG: outer membrane lipid asymmetry maintenance protein MlaD [Burkholderia sp.]|nr:outer membrane lipid asymmetry maintenance protein MlaD [Burkholderia sp.]